jgi:cyanate permease
MTEPWLTRVVIGGAVGYLVVLAWAMANLSYDLWGVLVTTPVLLLIGFALVNRAFHDDIALRRLMCAGLVAKLIGGMARYWVSFDAYGGATDAARYHTYGARVASRVWTGDITPF